MATSWDQRKDPTLTDATTTTTPVFPQETVADETEAIRPPGFVLSGLVRLVLYVVTALGTPVVYYLFSRGVIGAYEIALWTGEVTAVATLAASKTPVGKDNSTL